MPPPVIRPPSDIHLECNLLDDERKLIPCPVSFQAADWTNTWDHQINGHAGQQVRWTMQGTNSGQD